MTDRNTLDCTDHNDAGTGHVHDAESAVPKGRYHNDYSPRYQKPFDIYEKARAHMKKMKKEEKGE